MLCVFISGASNLAVHGKARREARAHNTQRPIRLPPPSHILWDSFRSSAEAQAAASTQTLAVAAAEFFGVGHPKFEALPVEFTAAQLARKARIAAWKACAATRESEREAGEGACLELKRELLRLQASSKKLWRALHRKYSKHCRQLRMTRQMRNAALDITRRSVLQPVDAEAFFKHQKSVMCGLQYRDPPVYPPPTGAYPGGLHPLHSGRRTGCN